MHAVDIRIRHCYARKNIGRKMFLLYCITAFIEHHCTIPLRCALTCMPMRCVVWRPYVSKE